HDGADVDTVERSSLDDVGTTELVLELVDALLDARLLGLRVLEARIVVVVRRPRELLQDPRSLLEPLALLFQGRLQAVVSLLRDSRSQSHDVPPEFPGPVRKRLAPWQQGQAERSVNCGGIIPHAHAWVSRSRRLGTPMTRRGTHEKNPTSGP